MINDQNNRNRDFISSQVNRSNAKNGYDFSHLNGSQNFKEMQPLENKADIVEKLINFLKAD